MPIDRAEGTWRLLRDLPCAVQVAHGGGHMGKHFLGILSRGAEFYVLDSLPGITTHLMATMSITDAAGQSSEQNVVATVGTTEFLASAEPALEVNR